MLHPRVRKRAQEAQNEFLDLGAVQPAWDKENTHPSRSGGKLTTCWSSPPPGDCVSWDGAWRLLGDWMQRPGWSARAALAHFQAQQAASSLIATISEAFRGNHFKCNDFFLHMSIDVSPRSIGISNAKPTE